MPLIRVARPFSMNTGTKPHLRYGIGVYDVSDAIFLLIMGSAHLRWHLMEECVARGDVLLQNRAVQQSWFAGSVYYRSLSIVAAIVPMPVTLWRWPAWFPNASHFPFREGEIEAAPGEQITVMHPHIREGGKEGEWREETRTVVAMALPFGPHYEGSGTPVAVRASSPFPITMPVIGDACVFGEQPTVPFRQIDTLPPAHPELPASVAAILRMQEARIIMAQTQRPPAPRVRATRAPTWDAQQATIDRQAEAVIAAQEGWMPMFGPPRTEELARLQLIATRAAGLAAALPRMRRTQGTLNENTSYATTAPPPSRWKFGDPVR
jgi:hypothetical protein